MLYAGKTIGLWLIVIFGLALVLVGGVLTYLGATGDSEARLFGNAFPYKIVGALGLFCGVIIAFLGLRRAFRLLDTIIHKGRSGVHWRHLPSSPSPIGQGTSLENFDFAQIPPIVARGKCRTTWAQRIAPWAGHRGGLRSGMSFLLALQMR